MNEDMDDQERIINENGAGGNEKLSKTLLASCVAALATFGFGYNMGYPSPVQKSIEYHKLTNPDGILTAEDFSWFEVSFCFYFILF